MTGASAGIGAALAVLLAEEGYDLVLVARREDRLNQLAERLEADHRVSAEVLAADLSSPEQLEEVASRVSSLERLELLVNNAGFAGYRSFLEVDPAVVRSLIELHCQASARLCRAAAPGMVARGRGAMVNVASLLGFSASMPMNQMPGRATYVGAKAFMIAFSRALSHELEPFGVRVMVACPGVVASEFHQVAGLGGPRAGSMSPEDAARAIARGVELREPVIVPGLEESEVIEIAEDRQVAIMRGGNRPELARRYRESQPAD